MRGARPPGCRLMRSRLTGASSSAGDTPASSGATMRLAITRFQCRSKATAGQGWWLSRMCCTARRAACMLGSSIACSRYMGA